MSQFLRCAPEAIDKLWSLFELPFAHIEKRSAGLWTSEGIRDRARRGDWQIWVLTEDMKALAVAASCITLTDAGQKWAEMLFCTGRRRDLWQGKITEFEDWARAEGCTRVRSIARLGWARTLPGYRMTHAFIEKDL